MLFYKLCVNQLFEMWGKMYMYNHHHVVSGVILEDYQG